MTQKVKRGDIFYIAKIGDEYKGKRNDGRIPGIVVSCEDTNETEQAVEIVYCKSGVVRDKPTNVEIRSTGIKTVAVCHFVHQVSINRLVSKMGHLSVNEQNQVDIAISIAMGLNFEEPRVIEKVVEVEKVVDAGKALQEENIALKAQVELLRSMAMEWNAQKEQQPVPDTDLPILEEVQQPKELTLKQRLEIARLDAGLTKTMVHVLFPRMDDGAILERLETMSLKLVDVDTLDFNRTKNIGNLFKRARACMGIPQKDFASMLKLGKQAYMMTIIENGEYLGLKNMKNQLREALVLACEQIDKRHSGLEE